MSKEEERRFCGVYMVRSPRGEVNFYTGKAFRMSFEERLEDAKTHRNCKREWGRPYYVWLREYHEDAVLIPLVAGYFTAREVSELEKLMIEFYRPSLNATGVLSGPVSYSEGRSAYGKGRHRALGERRRLQMREYHTLRGCECEVCGGTTSEISSKEKRHFWSKRHQQQLLSFLGSPLTFFTFLVRKVVINDHTT